MCSTSLIITFLNNVINIYVPVLLPHFIQNLSSEPARKTDAQTVTIL